jgi:hypothetical protein
MLPFLLLLLPFISATNESKYSNESTKETTPSSIGNTASKPLSTSLWIIAVVLFLDFLTISENIWGLMRRFFERIPVFLMRCWEVCTARGRGMKDRFVRRDGSNGRAGVEAADGVDMGPIRPLDSRDPENRD